MSTSLQTSERCCQNLETGLNIGTIRYIEKFREYGLPIEDGGSSFQRFQFCPWCGSILPASLRHVWLEKIHELGLEPGDPGIPKELLCDKWWRMGKV